VGELRKWGRGRLRLLRSRGWESPCVGCGVVAWLRPCLSVAFSSCAPLPLCAVAAQSLARGSQGQGIGDGCVPCPAACRSTLFLSPLCDRTPLLLGVASKRADGRCMLFYNCVAGTGTCMC